MTRARAFDLAAAGLVVILAVVNATLLPGPIQNLIEGGVALDWVQFVESGDRVFSGGLYDQTDSYGFRWSPVAAYAFAALGSIGSGAWRLLHVAAALTLPTWPMRLVTLASWPFWSDVETGNVMTFVLLAAALAARGSRLGTGAFLVLTLVMPRPLMLPIAIWLLWKQPEWRLPFIALVAVHSALVLASGWGPEWVSLLMSLGGGATQSNDLGPSRFLGPYWLLIGIPLAGILAWRGRLGWASLAVAYPYVLGYYFLMLILEVPPLRRGRLALHRGVPGPS